MSLEERESRERKRREKGRVERERRARDGDRIAKRYGIRNPSFCIRPSRFSLRLNNWMNLLFKLDR